MATVIVTCPRCGHEREVTREQLIAGTWKGRCPVCQPDDDKHAEPTPA